MNIIRPKPGGLDAILATHEKVIVQFYADWCGSCKLFAPTFRRLSTDERCTGITFVEINAELDQSARALANVDNLPFFATFRGGSRIDGVATVKESVVVAMLERLAV